MNLHERFGPVERAEPQTETAHQALLWGHDDLLAKAVGSFMTVEGWNVTHVANDGNVENLLQETRRLNPEVVILCREKRDASVFVFRLMEEHCCLKVITLGLDSNQMQVYTKQNIFVQGASDLLSIIQNGHFPDCVPGKEVRGLQDE